MKDYPWISSYPETVEWDHMIDPKPVYRILNDAVTKFPENVAIDFMGAETTYNELKTEVNKAAFGLKDLGVEKGTRVGILLPNCPQYIISYYAIMRAGGIAVQLSPLLSERELSHQIEDSGCEIIITLDLKACYGNIVGILGAAGIKKVVVGSLSDVLPFPKNVLFPIIKRKEICKIPKDARHITWREMMTECDEELEAVVVDPEKDVAVLQYTGGTTGVPKGAMLTHANIYSNAAQASLWCTEIEEGTESLLAVLPFFHVFAMTVCMNFSLYKGAKIILHPRFELVKVLKDVQKKKPTLMPGVPTMFNAINNYNKLHRYNLRSLKLCVSGGAPLPADVRAAFEDKTGCKLVEGYGLTESAPVVAFNPISNVRDGSIGLPMPQTTVTIEDMEKPGTRVPVGEVGELCVKGPQVMKGYWNKAEETENVLNNGKLRTGDIAKFDEDGFLYIVDRLKEMIITGGFNVYPRNIEEALYMHEHVKEAAVIGIPDESKGQKVKAFVAYKGNKEIPEGEMILFLKDKLAKYEVPSVVEIRDELPKTPIGKIDKKLLHEN